MDRWISLLFLAAFFSVVLIISVPVLRRRLFTIYVFRWFKTVLPAMSDTEKEALAAGDIWHEADLFRGDPNWEKLLSNPKPALTQTESDFIANEVETLCDMLDEWQITHVQHDVSSNVWNYLKTAGFFGLHAPTECGGKGFSALANSTIVQKISTKSLSVAVTVMVPNSLGPTELILNYGTEAQKQRYLHGLVKGIEMPCFALTSPEAGSDAAALIDNGVVCYGDYAGQKNILGVRLNWDKRYITLAPVATLIALAVKLRDPDHLLGSEHELGITVLLVPHDLPGLTIGKRHYPLNQAFLNGPIHGRDVFVSLDCIVGGKVNIGKGWQMLVQCLAAGRGISLPALSMGVGKLCFKTTGAYAKLRQQFNVSIGNFEGVAASLARIGAYTYMMEATGLLTLGAIDQNIKPSIVTSICKYHMTEMARQVIIDAMDIHGGRGIMLGPRNYLARTYEGSPIGITVEGANILMRCLVIFGQGAVRCHPYIKTEMEATADPDPEQGLITFDKALCGHVWYGLCNYTKLYFHSITGTIFCSAPNNTKWGKYYRRLSYLSLAMSSLSEMAMLFLGGSLKRKENLSARLGDILSFLYIASAVLKYSHDNGEAESDKPYVQWCLDYCLHKIQESVVYICINFPYKFVSKPMQWLIFPPWRNYMLPSDDLSIAISQDMQRPSELRDRLTANCAYKMETTDPIGRVELAWLKMLEVELLLSKLHAAVKSGSVPKYLTQAEKISAALVANIITSSESQALNEFDVMRLDAMQVDEFTSEELTGKKA